MAVSAVELAEPVLKDSFLERGTSGIEEKPTDLTLRPVTVVGVASTTYARKEGYHPVEEETRTTSRT